MSTAIETAGFWNQQATDVTEDISRRISAITEEKFETIHLFQLISVVLQRGNAVNISTFDNVWKSETSSENYSHYAKRRFNLVYFGPRTKKLDCSFGPPHISFSNDRILGAKELCFLNILSLLEGDKSLLPLSITGTPHMRVIQESAAVRW